MKVDTITKNYVQNADIFADIFNFFVYGGKQVIQPEQLSEKDTAKTTIPFGKDGEAVPIQRYRDVQMLYSAKTDGRVFYILYGAELQALIHYAMPVKSNLYDAVDYAIQVDETAKRHRKEMEQKRHLNESDEGGESRKKPNSGEFLSGFWKEDKLIPVVTLTIHFGAEEWDGPMSLFEMLDVPDPKILECMDNYRVRLISPVLMSDDEIAKFQSSLREVMLFIKYSKDKTALNEMLAKNQERFENLERRAANVIRAVTNMKINLDESEDQIDMCKAVQDMCDESRAEGIAVGIAEGIAKGKAEGRAEGKAEGRAEGEMSKAQEIAQKLHEMGFGIEQIIRAVGCDAGTVKQWVGLS